MKKINLLVLMLTLMFSTVSNAEQAVFKPVQELFSAMSAVDHKKMRTVVTEDFQLLEDGEDWSLNDLINVVQRSKYSRRNYFNIIRSEVMGNMAWVSYWNKATFHMDDKQGEVVWLESAVMIKQGNQWKIKMLHSTKIKTEDLPENIVLTEYTQ
ncbi:nuclear transport factor 2 family protein [Paraglaciecola arctica]|uniref:DUF4440 domain-containing protein n=1 Tax=Paraglaciecola arctica BSs20135 TaxID=493475 RepID=K6YNZ8_9ALTE|nr:nuclear transport factor 2 family protein [Paraglaciecola arctica]GAC19892.1 hypothetical protein GARC_2929 [Paraglaciecola arctica BSs20135]